MTATSHPVFLNQFLVKTLAPEEARTVQRYACRWQRNPDEGTADYALNRVCYQLRVPAARWRTHIVTFQPPECLESEEWQLTELEPVVLDCGDPEQREALATLHRQRLRQSLQQDQSNYEVERGSDNSIRIWQKQPKKSENTPEGWEARKGYCLDLRIDTAAHLYLDIDCAYRLWTPWTLHDWLEHYPDSLPLIKWVRNTYLKNNQYRCWQLLHLSQERPEDVRLPGLNITLAEYHRNERATDAEIERSRVVYVKDARIQQGGRIPHLSQRLTPSVTLELLSELGKQPQLRAKVDAVFKSLRINTNTRFQDAQRFARWLSAKYYGGTDRDLPPLTKTGYQLPPAVLLAKTKQVKQVAQVRQAGCVAVGETKFGLLNLASPERAYPPEIYECLEDIGRCNQVTLDLDSYRTAADLGNTDLARQRFWREWAEEGVRTILVVMLYSSDKQRIRNEALRAGITTQFVVPQNIDAYKAINVVLGLLCKAKWQPVHLQLSDTAEAAELIIGFDTGTNRDLYFGTPAFAVLANGQSLGWELPTVQRGEKLSGQTVWQTVLKLMDKFYTLCKRYPRKVLLMRDGLARLDEFERTIQELEQENIAVDLLSVRKSGAGRMAYSREPRNRAPDSNQQPNYRSVPKGTVVYDEQERSFLLVTSQAIRQELGSPRPLRVVHSYGTTSLQMLALQTYHLAQLHPGSGFSHARLPWVLHLAHKSSQEFSRIQPLSVLEGLDRDKLIAV
ncbi:argonaute PAZ domain-containing protein [Thermosynechococcaceae cyanobacterium Okahandja]